MPVGHFEKNLFCGRGLIFFQFFSSVRTANSETTLACSTLSVDGDDRKSRWSTSGIFNKKTLVADPARRPPAFSIIRLEQAKTTYNDSHFHNF